MNQFTIRDANEGDVPALTGLMNELGYPTLVDEMHIRFNGIAAHPDYKTIIAELDGEVAGMAGLVKGLFYEKNGGYLRILAFVVKDNMRGKGAGKLLLKCVEDWALTENLSMIFVNSGNRDERKAAHLLYKKMGYVIKSSGFVKQL